ncbi:FAD dependent oxidoreductase [Tilletiaria anomala UBC 951]|uniref:FAD dependent oxidoreductase n=1 Tax=Tilletiaria anomala (strain ATCC 24038 / CBS 436.72 / UBC 951) TaxID=1037660 RepID=A0A066VI03_TILAU|nr:FAD dependent oxidoreductase [Tilletiaria anomala UBC 951]KDN39938.1 FAD dependent oxidoreductase [Tilletiaria anomala UBC 951]
MPRAIIVGAGAYGASLAYTLIKSADDWNILLLDRAPCSPSVSSASKANSPDVQDAAEKSCLAPDAASFDINKIIRSDYTDKNYRDLGKEAIRLWRDEQGIWKRFYHETGVIFHSGRGSDTLCHGPGKGGATEKDRAYVQLGIRGAHEAEENVSDSEKLPAKAFHLQTPEEALSVFPELCRSNIGEGLSSIGSPLAPTAASDGGPRWKQDAYINPRGGWAEAAAATQYTLAQAICEGNSKGARERIKVVGDAQISELVVASDTSSSLSTRTRVIGVQTTKGDRFVLNDAEINDGQSTVVLCTGSWTRDLLEGLLPDRSEASSISKWPMAPSAQCVITIQLPKEIAGKYKGCPVLLNFNTGFYVFEPNHEGIMKAAIHSIGYQHPRPANNTVSNTSAPILQPAFTAGEQPSQSHPDLRMNGNAAPSNLAAAGLDAVAEEYIPATKLTEMLDELAEVYPEVAAYARDAIVTQSKDKSTSTKIVKTRVCHYSDTADENWLIDHVPGTDGLIVASGDSGHGFKFLPMIGRLIAARMGVSSPAIPPLSEHQAKVFSFEHHFSLTSLTDVAKTDSNRFKPASQTVAR